MTRRALAGWSGLVALAFWLVAVPVAAVPTPGGPAGDAPAAHGGHGDGHGHHDGIGEFNWFYGFVGEKDGATPGLLWRPPGMQPPFAATLLNYAVLFFILYRFGAKPISEGLKKRKTTILRGMDEAAKMKGDAAARLEEYEDKLKHIDDEIERVKQEMREAGKRERERILAEAKDKQARMERDAKILIEQELKEARQQLHRETVQSAVESAESALKKQVQATDHQRLADEYLTGMKSALEGSKVGRA